ncbi:hypothetical protein [Knoellia aerolata]|nr:hypothetical protein [Knoellia aerolata]
MPGIFFTRGAQLRIPAGGLTIRMTDQGEVVMEPVRTQLRMDLWPQWLHEALDATIAARVAYADLLAEVAGQGEAGDRLAELLDRELRACMRAISSSAFAVDAFYASVQARSPAHPDRAKWRAPGRRRTPRQAQVSEALRYHLKLRQPGASEIRARIKQLFKFRGWAVHADATFRDAIHREDLDLGVGWHHAAFRTENAVATLGSTFQMLDVLVVRLERGCQELREYAPFARERLDDLLDLYDAEPGLPPLRRARDEMRDTDEGGGKGGAA